jgi:hypothetical protein
MTDNQPTTISSVPSEQRNVRPSMKARRSSLFQRARMSFYRSKGARGADIDTLRGTRGADFEGTGRVSRGVEGARCLCWGGGGDDGTKDRLVLVKGPFCFIFASEDAPAPKYAIGLQYMRPEVKTAGQFGRPVVLLKDNLGDTQYEVNFPSEDDASRFAKAVTDQAKAAETEEVRKRLGHEHLLNKRASVRYAESIAKKKVNDQPDKPVSAQELISTMPPPAL